MRNYLKILMVVGLLALVIPLVLGYLVGPIGATHPNRIGDHQFSENMVNETCDGCHEMTTYSPSGAVQGAHRRHLVSGYLTFWDASESTDKGCGDCHKETVFRGSGAGLGSGYEGDLSYNDTDTPNTGDVNGSGGLDNLRSARKDVNADTCGNCHGQFNTTVGDAARHNGVDYVQLNPSDCVQTGACHVGAGSDDPVIAHAGLTYLDHDVTDIDPGCPLCHGGQAWYLTLETTTAIP